MALISSRGGRLIGPKPPSMRISDAASGGPMQKVPKMRVHKVAPARPHPVVKRAKVVTKPVSAGSAGSQDPFDFIKGLMASTDPAQIRALIDPIYAPLRQQVNDQIAQIDAQSKARAQQMSEIYQAFAQYAGGMQGQI